MRVTSEQYDSLIATLHEAGIKTEGEKEVVLVAGSVPDELRPAHLAFCPSAIRVTKTMSSAFRFWRSARRLNGEILFRNEELVAQKILNRRGFVVMHGRILTFNSTIELDMDPSRIDVIPSTSQYLRHLCGKEEAGNILNKVLHTLA